MTTPNSQPETAPAMTHTQKPDTKTGDTYSMPSNGWTCFHCGETFTTPGSAKQHFGPTPNDKPGCIEKVNLGGERGLLTSLREREDELTRYRNEDGETQREIMRIQSLHSQALRSAEETGYSRGLNDASALLSERDRLRDALEQAHVLHDKAHAAHMESKKNYSWHFMTAKHVIAEALANTTPSESAKGGET